MKLDSRGSGCKLRENGSVEVQVGSFGKWEKADEMAQENINRAKACTLEYMELVCCIFTVIAMTLFAGIDLPVSLSTFLSSVCFVFVGCSKLLTGILYKRYEEE